MKIGFISEYAAHDVRAWSGIPFYMRKNIQNDSHRLTSIGPLARKWPTYYKAKTLVYRDLLRRKYLWEREHRVLTNYSDQVLGLLDGIEVDVLLSPSSIPISTLHTEQPIVLWTDAVFGDLVDFYERFSNLPRAARAAGDAMEQSALDRSALAIYSSEWAADGATSRYGADPAKVKVVPFGANLESSPTASQVERAVDSRSDHKCRLLFNGVDWLRKGGDIAVEVARGLNAAGLETTLTIAGVPRLPAELRDIPFIQSLGFVTKATAEGRETLEAALAESHFLILPSRAECFGIALCEANAFGVPFLTSRVGGIPTIARDGRNGWSFSADAGTADYVNRVLDLFSNYSDYRELTRTAFEEYETRLNWPVAATRVRELLKGVT